MDPSTGARISESSRGIRQYSECKHNDTQILKYKLIENIEQRRIYAHPFLHHETPTAALADIISTLQPPGEPTRPVLLESSHIVYYRIKFSAVVTYLFYLIF